MMPINIPVLYGRQKPLNLLSIPNLAAWYDLSDPSSYILGTGIKLLADKSGNSAVNVLCNTSPTVAGNGASCPGINFSAGLDIDFDLAPTSWAPTAATDIVGQWNTAGNRAFLIEQDTTGNLLIYYTPDGSTTKGPYTSTSPMPYFAFGRGQGRITRDPATGNITFYYRYLEGDSWTPLGTVVSSPAGAIFGTTTPQVTIGSHTNNNAYGQVAGAAPANYFRVRFRTTIGGSNVADFNPSLAAKLAATFISSTGETWTIKSPGDTGAPICGANDSLASSDGIAKCIASAPRSLAQPFARMLVARLDTYSLGKYLLDGGAVNSGALLQTTGSPKLSISAGTTAAENAGLIVGQLAVIWMIFNGANSSLQINRGTPIVGNAGTNAANGGIFGCSGAIANFSAASIAEWADFSAIPDAGTIARITQDRIRKWAIAA